MANAIGPTFNNELKTAGVDTNGISWGDDGIIEFRKDVTQATKDAVATVFLAHDPLTPMPLSALSSMEELVQDLFIVTDPEKVRSVGDITAATDRIKARFAGRAGQL